MGKRIMGAILIATVLIGGYYLYKSVGAGKKTVILKGFVGGEKMTFLENEEVKGILKRKYGIIIDYYKAGSIQMVKTVHGKDVDFLWPSSQVALELFKQSQPRKLIKADVIFNSPIVIYSWKKVADALIKVGIVKQIKSAFYIINFQKLVAMVNKGTKWKDIGIEYLFDRVLITSTDPTKSNSGNMFAGLLANVLAGEVVTPRTLTGVLPRIVGYFERLGMMLPSSSDLFRQYLSKGEGAFPLIAGYESQMIEFHMQHRDLWKRAGKMVRILYPRPTVWSSHPLMVLSPRANSLLRALRDQEIQDIAWKKHGFRTGLGGIQNDPATLKLEGIPATISYIINMPQPQVMEQIIQALHARK